MRAALLIGLTVAVLAATAQAQTSPYRNPNGMGPAKNPYDLPKAYRGNPYDRDYSKPDPATKGPGYRNADGSAYRRDSSPYSGAYSGRAFDSPFGASSSRNRRNPNCSKPGVVC